MDTMHQVEGTKWSLPLFAASIRPMLPSRREPHRVTTLENYPYSGIPRFYAKTFHSSTRIRVTLLFFIAMITSTRKWVISLVG